MLFPGLIAFLEAGAFRLQAALFLLKSRETLQLARVDETAIDRAGADILQRRAFLQAFIPVWPVMENQASVSGQEFRSCVKIMQA